MVGLNKEEIPMKIMDNSKIAFWVANLVDRFQRSNLTIDEKKALIKDKFINCAEYQHYKLDECDLMTLDDKINIMYN
jgi:hypothetical protein